MNKVLFVLLLLLGSLGIATAQQFTQASDNDPAAKRLLDRMSQRFASFEGLHTDFNLVIEIPEMDKEVQKGSLKQRGNAYRLSLDNQEIISDGSTIWVYLKNNEEVQINCMADFEGEGLLSPNDLLNEYNSGNYIYVLGDAFTENGKTVQQIEFKPVDADSDYSKIRLTFLKETLDPVRMKVFAKDGSRFTLELLNVTPNPTHPKGTFNWDKSQCPDCYIEDLRIDCE